MAHNNRDSLCDQLPHPLTLSRLKIAGKDNGSSKLIFLCSMASSNQINKVLDGDEIAFNYDDDLVLESREIAKLVDSDDDVTACAINNVIEGAEVGKKEAKKKVKPAVKPKKKPTATDRPKRPLSGYNLFFKMERERIVNNREEIPITEYDIANFHFERSRVQARRRHRKSHGKIGFRELARTIAEKWKNLDGDTRALFEDRASEEKCRYLIARDEWKNTQTRKTDDGKAKSTKAMPVDEVSITSKDDLGTFNKSAFSPLKDVPFQVQMQANLALARIAQSIVHQNQLGHPQRNGMQGMSQFNTAAHQQRSFSNQYHDNHTPFHNTGNYYDMANQAFNMAQGLVSPAAVSSSSHAVNSRLTPSAPHRVSLPMSGYSFPDSGMMQGQSMPLLQSHTDASSAPGMSQFMGGQGHQDEPIPFQHAMQVPLQSQQLLLQQQHDLLEEEYQQYALQQQAEALHHHQEAHHQAHHYYTPQANSLSYALVEDSTSGHPHDPDFAAMSFDEGAGESGIRSIFDSFA